MPPKKQKQLSPKEAKAKGALVKNAAVEMNARSVEDRQMMRAINSKAAMTLQRQKVTMNGDESIQEEDSSVVKTTTFKRVLNAIVGSAKAVLSANNFVDGLQAGAEDDDPGVKVMVNEILHKEVEAVIGEEEDPFDSFGEDCDMATTPSAALLSPRSRTMALSGTPRHAADAAFRRTSMERMKSGTGSASNIVHCIAKDPSLVEGIWTLAAHSLTGESSEKEQEELLRRTQRRVLTELETADGDAAFGDDEISELADALAHTCSSGFQALSPRRALRDEDIDTLTRWQTHWQSSVGGIHMARVGTQYKAQAIHTRGFINCGDERRWRRDDNFVNVGVNGRTAQLPSLAINKIVTAGCREAALKLDLGTNTRAKLEQIVSEKAKNSSATKTVF